MKTVFPILIMLCLIGSSSRQPPPTQLAGPRMTLVPPDTAIPPIYTGSSGPYSRSGRAHAHPHGDKVCASGCAVSNHPTPTLTQRRFNELVSALSVNPEDNAAIDEILYYGPQSRARLLSNSVRLPANLQQTLLGELKRMRAVVELRLVEVEDSSIIAILPDQNVPLDLRHEFDLIEQDIPPLLASGTIKRVGRDRLWSRL